MAIEKNKAKSKKEGKEKKPSEKKEKKAKGTPREGSRKAFILSAIQEAGSKGITTEALVKATDKKFNYSGDKSSGMRVNNTVREAREAKLVKVDEESGTITWTK